jgi:hypothetical protein
MCGHILYLQPSLAEYRLVVVVRSACIISQHLKPAVTSQGWFVGPSAAEDIIIISGRSYRVYGACYNNRRRPQNITAGYIMLVAVPAV